ncbi:MAG: hypothetical protein JWM77_1892 [Rhodospirillales bacterium]|nr:hypothetical protein [Rhodospirillales bacterium]
MALAMLPFVSGGCFADPCPAINQRMQLLTADLMANPDLFSSDAAGYETQRLAVDSARYGCLAR